jgi:hypothetical protein
MKTITCNRCLETGLSWQISKTGRTYLAARTEIRGDSGRTIKVIYPVHRCTEDIEVIESRKQAQQQRLDSGEIIKGQRIVVVKGRKVAIGTEGVVFWVAPQPDGYDVIKVGFTDDNGAKFYTNIKNVEVAR